MQFDLALQPASHTTDVAHSGPRLRADLEWSYHSDQARWIAQDPLIPQFYSFNELERSATLKMNGRLTASRIAEELSQTYPALGIDATWVGELIARLRANHLLQLRTQTDLHQAVRAHRRRQMPSWFAQLLSPLAIRVPLFNPTRLLHVLSPLAWLLFQPLLLCAWLIAGCVLGFFVLSEVLTTGLAASIDWHWLRGDSWWLLLVSYLVAKSLHELGHGLACVRYGAKCRELGVLFLCLAPCLYCDTSDSWKLPSKWQRATIAGAGIMVEWMLATLAAAVWLSTQPGTLHSVAASLMIVCSVGTLLINSNPLLKYDGYYLLSDLWGVPNLSEQSSDAVRALSVSALSGQPLAVWHLDAPVALLASYWLMATAYRTFILGAILWIGWSVLVPLGLGLVAAMLTGSLLLGWSLGCLRGTMKIIRETRSAGTMRIGRWIAFVAAIVVIIIFVMSVPLPQAMRARAVTDFEDKQPLFASQTAELVYAAPVDRFLKAGELLLQFDAPASDYELLELRGQIAIVERTLEQLHLRSALDPTTAYLIPTKNEELQQLQARQRVLLRELQSLTHPAPQDGYLLTASHVVARPLAAFEDDRWQANPLDPKLIGCTCERGALIGWFSPKQRLILTAIVPEDDVKRLRVGQTANVGWDADIKHVRTGIVSRIAPEAINQLPRELIGDRALLSERNANGDFLPAKPHYEVTIDVSGDSANAGQPVPQEIAGREVLHQQPTQRPPALRGSLATVQFELPQQTVWQRVVELVRKNLKPF